MHVLGVRSRCSVCGTSYYIWHVLTGDLARECPVCSLRILAKCSLVVKHEIRRHRRERLPPHVSG